MAEKGENREMSFKLRSTAAALNSAVSTYENILNGDINDTPELKKAVQDSIKELCTAISVAVKEN